MPTDDERREAARLLRAVKPIWCDISDPMCMLVTSIGFSCTANGDCHGSSERRECVMRVFPLLADLIEPRPERTCQMVSAFDTDELDDIQECISSSPEDTLAYKCKGCGFDFRYERGLYPNYCPNCGTKVFNDV